VFIRVHPLPFLFFLASIALFWVPLHQLVSLSLNDQRYSHLILIPVISAFFLYRERHKIFPHIAFRPRLALPFLAASLLLYFVHSSPNYALSMAVLSMVLFWFAGFAAFYGVQSFKAALFPLLFLLLLVPVPFTQMDQIISVLQRGAAEATYRLFSLAGVPMFRDGVRFDLPGIGIEVAAECSSIHSAWALFITGLLVAHMFLKSLWPKALLAILTIPIAMFTNAIRIVTLWFLGTHVDPSFIFGPLHHNGGILFSLISLSLLLSFLYLLRKLERPPRLATK
jgi:exosortase